MVRKTVFIYLIKKKKIKMKDLYKIDRSFLHSIKLPKETRTYKPVSHLELDNLIRDVAETSGFRISNFKYTSAREGLVVNARYIINDISDEDMSLQIGWQNSYNKTLSLKFAIGAQVFICENGVVVGDVGAFKKKHSGDILYFAPETIEKAIRSAEAKFDQIRLQKEVMKEIIIDKRAKSELIGRLFLENNIITSTQLNIIKNELNTPTFDYKAPNSIWELYQFVTFSMKDIHPTLYMNNHINSHNFFWEASKDYKKPSFDIAIKELVEPKLTAKQITLLEEIAEREISDELGKF